MPHAYHTRKGSWSGFVWFLSSFLPLILYSTSANGYIKLIENSGQMTLFESKNYPEFSQKEKIYPAIEYINSAKESLEFEIYEMRSEAVQNSIIHAMQKGITVHILAEPDPVGNSCDAFGKQEKTAKKCQSSINFHNAFSRAKKEFSPKSEIRFYNKNLCWDEAADKPVHCYQHGKIIIRDSKEIYLSTGNLNDSSICTPDHRANNSCNRDFSIVTDQSNIVLSFQDIFKKDWDVGSSCDLPAKTVPEPNNHCNITEKEIDLRSYTNGIKDILGRRKTSDLITLSPYLQAKLPAFLHRAKKRIQMQAQYLRDPAWAEELREAAQRGVKIELTLASFCHFNRKNGMGWISNDTFYGAEGYLRFWLDPLREGLNPASIRVFSQGVPLDDSQKNGYLHSKIMIIDEKEAWVGSTNGSHTSTHVNREFGIFIRNPDLVQKLSRFVAADHQKSMKIEEHIPDPKGPRSNRPGTCLVSK